MAQQDEEEQGNLDDRELPDESDMDDDDDEGPDLVPCPFCKTGIYEDSEFCPHCGKYISKEDTPWGTKVWVAIIVAAVIVAILIGWMSLR